LLISVFDNKVIGYNLVVYFRSEEHTS